MNYFDELCGKIFGFIPPGKGKSYELFVNCVLQHLNGNNKIENGTFHKSSFSEGKYQLDGLVEEEYTSVKAFVESKNYLDRGAKVGRDDIQKLSGALQVLNDINKGIFASATDYTKPAKQYSEDLSAAEHKPIDLYIVRPVKEEDTEGRIMGININMHIQAPHLKVDNVTWGEKGKQKLQEMGYEEGDQFNIAVQYIYDSKGEVITEVNDLYQDAQKSGVTGDNFWEFNEDAYLLMDDNLVPFEKMHYNLTYSTALQKIEMHFEPVIYIKSVDGSIEQLIDTDAIKKAYQQLNKELAK